MEAHVRIVGILHIVLGALTLLVGVFVLLTFGGIAGLISSSGDRGAVQAAPFIVGIGGIICVVLTIVAVPGIVAGIGMLEFRSWGRILGIVISVLDLIHFPFGTALGIYGLWALLSPEGEQLFQNPPPPRRLRA
jgi:hypothetical protein